MQWLRQHSLSVVLIILFSVFLTGQGITGFRTYNQDQTEHNNPTIGFSDYLRSGHFIEATFENWESEFLQMGAYIILTAYLVQKGSAESKKLEDIDGPTGTQKRPHAPTAPWPVRRGGWWLRLYEHSLSLAFILLFLMAFTLHGYGGAKETCQENVAHNEQCLSMGGYMTSSKFWFESFQNWQSEFLAVFAIVVLSVFLREKGSPESKPVDTPHHKTGK